MMSLQQILAGAGALQVYGSRFLPTVPLSERQTSFINWEADLAIGVSVWINASFWHPSQYCLE
jgi:hypothetical protein